MPHIGKGGHRRKVKPRSGSDAVPEWLPPAGKPPAASQPSRKKRKQPAFDPLLGDSKKESLPRQPEPPHSTPPSRVRGSFRSRETRLAPVRTKSKKRPSPMKAARAVYGNVLLGKQKRRTKSSTSRSSFGRRRPRRTSTISADTSHSAPSAAMIVVPAAYYPRSDSQQSNRVKVFNRARSTVSTIMHRSFTGPKGNSSYVVYGEEFKDPELMKRLAARPKPKGPDYIGEAARIDSAATVVQRHWRGVMGRKFAAEYAEEVRVNNAALHIQRVWRGTRDRHRVERLSGTFRDPRVVRRRIRAATRIQRGRRSIVRKRQEKLDNAAMMIQAAYRGGSTRTYLKRERAATRIQSARRGATVRSELKKLHFAASRIQRYHRCKTLTEKFRRKVLAAHMIQRVWKAAAEQWHRIRRFQAATAIQRQWKLMKHFRHEDALDWVRWGLVLGGMVDKRDIFLHAAPHEDDDGFKARVAGYVQQSSLLTEVMGVVKVRETAALTIQHCARHHLARSFVKRVQHRELQAERFIAGALSRNGMPVEVDALSAMLAEDSDLGPIEAKLLMKRFRLAQMKLLVFVTMKEMRDYFTQVVAPSRLLLDVCEGLCSVFGQHTSWNGMLRIILAPDFYDVAMSLTPHMLRGDRRERLVYLFTRKRILVLARLTGVDAVYLLTRWLAAMVGCLDTTLPKSRPPSRDSRRSTTSHPQLLTRISENNVTAGSDSKSEERKSSATGRALDRDKRPQRLVFNTNGIDGSPSSSARSSLRRGTSAESDASRTSGRSRSSRRSRGSRVSRGSRTMGRKARRVMSRAKADEALASACATLNRTSTEDFRKLAQIGSPDTILIAIAAGLCTLSRQRPSWAMTQRMLTFAKLADVLSKVEPMDVTIRQLRTIDNLIVQNKLGEVSVEDDRRGVRVLCGWLVAMSDACHADNAPPDGDSSDWSDSQSHHSHSFHSRASASGHSRRPSGDSVGRPSTGRASTSSSSPMKGSASAMGPHPFAAAARGSIHGGSPSHYGSMHASPSHYGSNSLSRPSSRPGSRHSSRPGTANGRRRRSKRRSSGNGTFKIRNELDFARKCVMTDVMPADMEALAAVEKPTTLVALVSGMLCLIHGISPPSWAAAKVLIVQPDFIADCVDIRPSAVAADSRALVREIFKMHNVWEEAQSSSAPVKALTRWAGVIATRREVVEDTLEEMAKRGITTKK